MFNTVTSYTTRYLKSDKCHIRVGCQMLNAWWRWVTRVNHMVAQNVSTNDLLFDICAEKGLNFIVDCTARISLGNAWRYGPQNSIIDSLSWKLHNVKVHAAPNYVLVRSNPTKLAVTPFGQSHGDWHLVCLLRAIIGNKSSTKNFSKKWNPDDSIEGSVKTPKLLTDSTKVRDRRFLSLLLALEEAPNSQLCCHKIPDCWIRHQWCARILSSTMRISAGPSNQQSTQMLS